MTRDQLTEAVYVVGPEFMKYMGTNTKGVNNGIKKYKKMNACRRLSLCEKVADTIIDKLHSNGMVIEDLSFD